MPNQFKRGDIVEYNNTAIGISGLGIITRTLKWEVERYATVPVCFLVWSWQPDVRYAWRNSDGHLQRDCSAEYLRVVGHAEGVDDAV